jgi:hypothetical protein
MPGRGRDQAAGAQHEDDAKDHEEQADAAHEFATTQRRLLPAVIMLRVLGMQNSAAWHGYARRATAPADRAPGQPGRPLRLSAPMTILTMTARRCGVSRAYLYWLLASSGTVFLLG